MKKKILVAALALCAVCLIGNEKTNESNNVMEIVGIENEGGEIARIIPPLAPPRPTTPQQNS